MASLLVVSGALTPAVPREADGASLVVSISVDAPLPFPVELSVVLSSWSSGSPRGALMTLAVVPLQLWEVARLRAAPAGMRRVSISTSVG